MPVRSPVRGQIKWFLRRLPVDQRSHPLKGSPHRGHPVLDGWVSRLGCFGRMSQLCCGQTRIMWGLFLLKTTCPHGDEVPRPQQPPLAPIVIPVGGFPCPWSYSFVLLYASGETQKRIRFS
ncbi:hypothetical protein E2C01_063739 [Portunus trituberculatus]|uniref:Uncharacterized protein n=1 Tax=Portunus trituberculatus TaxID=210409 RepID=A0A5B7HH68_PORTR|nr:hypothetical protein [Portunus trituberculatus]